MGGKTTDELLELLQWIADRHRYRLLCGIRDGAGYAADCKMETAALHELDSRGFFRGYSND